jgi:hypothetical protein
MDRQPEFESKASRSHLEVQDAMCREKREYRPGLSTEPWKGASDISSAITVAIVREGVTSN